MPSFDFQFPNCFQLRPTARGQLAIGKRKGAVRAQNALTALAKKAI
jgi:hypothetical protein